MKKFFQRFAATVLLVGATLVPVIAVHAQAQFSLLPVTSKDLAGCKTLMAEFEGKADQSSMLKGSQRDDTLGCAIKTGLITFSMVPYFITYIANFLLGMSGIVTVLFIVIGGFHYVIGGLTADKEKGKNTIMHALMGMGVSLLAWTIATVIINAVTG